MSDEPKFVVEDARNSLLKLRSDLVIAARNSGEWSGYFIEDPLRAKFFRLGIAEHAVLSRLDGKTTIAEACGDAALQVGVTALSEHGSLALCRWALEAQLVQPVDRDETARLTKQAKRAAKLKVQAAINPLCARLPIVDPSRVVDRLTPRLDWVFNRPALLVWCVAMIYAIYLIASEYESFARSADVIFSRENWWLLAAAWLGLKVVHEAAHAVACRKFGGSVSQAGVFLLLLVPVPYVDVTSAWRFTDKWQRIIVAAAGMYVELFLAAVATFVWASSTNAETRCVAQSVIAMAAVATLLVNGNPLMRFDGYYILSDWLEIPNLSALGNQRLIGIVERWSLGTRRASNLTPRQRRIVTIYAVLSLLWRAFVYITIVLALGALVARWHLAAGYLAVSAFAVWFAYRGFQGIRRLVATAQPLSPRRLAAVGSCGLVVAGLVIAWLLSPAAIRAHAIVEYAPLVVVRAGAAGFVEEVLVADGQWIPEGHEIARLSNDELRIRLRDAELEIQQSQMRLRLHRQAEEHAKEQAETAKLHALQRKRDEITQQAKALVVKAPSAGQVVARDLDSLVGRYLAKGDVVAIVGDPRAKELIVAVPDYDAEAVLHHETKSVSVRAGDSVTGAFQARLASVEPRATMQPPHEALSSSAGGPLAVRSRDDGDDSDQDDELVQGCFKARVALTAEQSESLHAGQFAIVRFTADEQSVAERLFSSLSRFVDERLAASGPVTD
jgi:putative peptide zinc metalloprotease protein